MLRTAFQPRWLALLALALALAGVFAALGNWQLTRSRGDDRPVVVADAEPVPLQDLLRPQTPYSGRLLGRTVEVSGELVGPSLRVTGRLLDGEKGAWVLSRMVVDTAQGDASLPVVRGWVADGAEPPAAPVGAVTLTGRMEPSEAPQGGPPGTSVTTVSSADLVNRWGQPIWTGFLVADEAVAAPGSATTTLRAIPEVPVDDRSFALQNLSYALQWWVFALFAVFVWWRLVRDAATEQAPVDNGSQPENDAVDATRGART